MLGVITRTAQQKEREPTHKATFSFNNFGAAGLPKSASDKICYFLSDCLFKSN